MNDIYVSVTGYVATKPRAVQLDTGLHITSFRFGATPRRFDTKTGQYVDGQTVWSTVTCFRHLAQNVAACVQQGERVIVTGRLRTPEWFTDGVKRSGVEIEADSIGHDLTFATTLYQRVRRVEVLEQPGRQEAHALAREVEQDAIDSSLAALLGAPGTLGDPDEDDAFAARDLEEDELVDA